MKVTPTEWSGHVPGVGACNKTIHMEPEAELHGIRRAILRQKSSMKWFIVALMAEDDEYCLPIGPFDTYETALVTLRLMS